jgi:hypothetical protein
MGCHKVQGWEKPNFFWPMHWVFDFDAKNPIPTNKTMIVYQLLPYVFQLACIIKGGKIPTFFPADALGFWF